MSACLSAMPRELPVHKAAAVRQEMTPGPTSLLAIRGPSHHGPVVDVKRFEGCMISLVATTVGLIWRDLRHDRVNAVDILRHEDPATYSCEKGRSERSTHRVPAHILAHACNVAD